MFEYNKDTKTLRLKIFGIRLSVSFSFGKILFKNFLPLIWFLDYIIPKNDKKIIFNSIPDYCDNSLAYYDFLKTQHKNEYKLIWILNNIETEKKYNNSYFYYSIKGLYHLITSKYFVTTHAYNFLDMLKNDKHTVLNFWHGMPIKTIGFNEKTCTEEILNRYKKLGEYSHLFVSSDIFGQLMISTFEGKYFNTHVVGQPRNDLIFQDINKNKIEELFNLSKFNKVILYMPTYKEALDIRENQVETKYNNLFYMGDYNEKIFVDYLETNNILFIMKPHPFDEKFYSEHMGTLPNSKNFKYVTKDYFLVNDINPYEIFKYMDLMISDFSSVTIDYLILNKPVIYLDNLTNEYSKNRGMILEDNYEILMPGVKVDTFNNLMYEMNNNIENDSYKTQREKRLPLLHKYCDNKACERIFEIMKGL